MNRSIVFNHWYIFLLDLKEFVKVKYVIPGGNVYSRGIRVVVDKPSGRVPRFVYNEVLQACVLLTISCYLKSNNFNSY